MNPYETLKLSILAGEIMLSNGAETHRIEDTMVRMMKSCGYENAESFVTATGIIASIDGAKTGLTTMVKRVSARTYNYEKIVLVNDLSRALAEKRIEPKEAVKKLHTIKCMLPYSGTVITLASAVSSACFAYIFGGTLSDCANAFITGLFLQSFIRALSKRNVTSVLINILGGGVIALLSLIIMNCGIGDTIDKVIIGSIMPLVPGISFTNAIRDIFAGDYLSGTARAMDALLVAIAIATGVGFVLKLWFYCFGGVFI